MFLAPFEGASSYHVLWAWLLIVLGITKKQNPALYLSGETGFCVIADHFKSSFCSGSKEETWFGNAADYCLYLTLQKVNGNWPFDEWLIRDMRL